ncbi:MAG TPA: ribosome small subunit-dependent GTPase A [Wenzhouxiangella sp.]
MKTQPSRVLVTHSDHGTALMPDGLLSHFYFNRSLDRPLAGDWIELDESNRLTAICPRANTFGRGDHKGRFKPTAANIDQLLIVIAPEPEPSLDLMTRYLAMAEQQHIKPIFVLNKTDLGIPDSAAFHYLQDLKELGYITIETNTKDEVSLKTLAEQIKNQTSILAGQSGVGKSSILNRLIPGVESLIGQLSQATGKGKHTTTTTRLYPLPQGGYLVDSPGVWEYGLWQIPVAELAESFVEFRPFLGQCRFRDCTHDHEPGCALLDAGAQGQIKASRLDAWRRLLAEQSRYQKLEHHQGKGSPLA